MFVPCWEGKRPGLIGVLGVWYQSKRKRESSPQTSLESGPRDRLLTVQTEVSGSMSDPETDDTYLDPLPPSLETSLRRMSPVNPGSGRGR